MIEIHNLEVRFDVEGESEDEAFVRLLGKYLPQVLRRQREAAAREQLMERERALGDQPSGGDR